MELENDGDTNSNWRAQYSHQGLVQRQENLEIRGRVETI